MCVGGTMHPILSQPVLQTKGVNTEVTKARFGVRRMWEVEEPGEKAKNKNKSHAGKDENPSDS